MVVSIETPPPGGEPFKCARRHYRYFQGKLEKDEEGYNPGDCYGQVIAENYKKYIKV